MSDNGCMFQHRVSALIGVKPTTVENLPQTCTCGRPITYSDQVHFFPHRPWKSHGSVLVEQVSGPEPYMGPTVSVNLETTQERIDEILVLYEVMVS